MEKLPQELKRAKKKKSFSEDQLSLFWLIRLLIVVPEIIKGTRDFKIHLVRDFKTDFDWGTFAQMKYYQGV